jgi:hypothetical protein
MTRAAAASCGVEACSTASAAASADFLTAAVTRPSPMCSCGRMSTCVKYGADVRTAHQSMNGLPWCGVEMVVSESGVYSSDRILEIRYRQSSPPIECAIKFTPRPYTRAERARSSSCARSTMDAVLLARHQRGRSERRGDTQGGTDVTNTSAPTVFRRISSTFFQ